MPKDLASYRRGVERIRQSWPSFCARRRERLVEHERHGGAAEKVAENVLEDLFTMALDWKLSDINHQIGFADLVLTQLGIKYLIIEAKRPGALAWSRRAVEAALDQAVRYADEQKVRCVAVSDGTMLYAADVMDGGLRDRVFAPLDALEAPEHLWWLSVHGIYRQRHEVGDAVLRLLPEIGPGTEGIGQAGDGALLHPKYKLPARCFGYVGDANDPRTWKLPYLTESGEVDTGRLPGAIRAIISNYRGTKVQTVPEVAVPEVLVRLGRGAASIRKLPGQGGASNTTYEQLAAILEQLGKLKEVLPG
jgi:hypothetical protein